ncbi:MAG: 2-amino-4-hydroxy-6-hydroxymethyldihydropteridine diphosphokinase [Candidatus Latescibacteria bacterium]|nr:2-amino-4-hydroxy-6-hydroxymethyldihydropteridine diphosphokinase [Candidatus Latescibacterota bacterium]
MTVYLGLGSNLGEKFQNLQNAVNLIAQTDLVQVITISPVYKTKPVGKVEQPDFFNAVIKIVTTIPVFELLRACLSIEKQLGRKREIRWEQRIIDIDLLLYNTDIIRTEELTVPHPRMHERAFVLKPLADIAPDVIHPILKKSIIDMLCDVSTDGIKKMQNFVLVKSVV